MRLAAADLGLTPLRSATAQTPSARLGAWHDALAAARVPDAPPTQAVARSTTDSLSVSPEGQAKSLTNPDAQQKQVLELLDRMFGITQVQSMDLKIATSQSSGASHALSTSNDGQTQTYAESYRAFDQTSLTASGTITLDDGRTFNLDLQYQRTVAFASDLTWQRTASPDGAGPLPAWAGGNQIGNAIPSWLAQYQTTGVSAGASATDAAPSAPGASLLKQLKALLEQLQQINGTPAVDTRA